MGTTDAQVAEQSGGVGRVLGETDRNGAKRAAGSRRWLYLIKR